MNTSHKKQYSKSFIIIAIVFAVNIIAGILIFKFVLPESLNNDSKSQKFNQIETVKLYETYISTGSFLTNDVCYDVFYTEDASAKPIAILQHGLTGSRTDNKALGMRLASEGFFVICPDAYGHGDTKSPDGVLSVPEIVVKTSENVDVILKHLSETSTLSLDFEHIYYAGFSLGAMSAYHYGAYGDYPLTVIAACCGTPDFAGLKGSSIVYNTYSYGKWGKITNSDGINSVDTFLEKNSPMNNFNQFNNTNILMQIGGLDDTIPADGSLNFYNQMLLQNDFTAPVLTTYQEQGHEITDNNIMEIIKFFLQRKES